MAGFVQIIEFSTSRFDEMEKFNDEWRRRHRERGYNWLVLAADRDNPGKYAALVQFDSYEAAMANNDDPATREFAEKMMELSDGPPVFRNLDVVRTEGMSG